MNKSSEYRVGVGASSILMIFIVLCLTTLGVLSFASARADLLLTQRRTQKVQGYYTSAAQADMLLAEIDAALLAAQRTPETFREQVLALADLDERIVVAGEPGEETVSFTLAASETQSLHVELAVKPSDASTRYTLLRHQLVYTAEWAPDNALNLKTEPDI